MTTGAWWAFGSVLKLGDGETEESFATVAELSDIDGPSQSKDTIEVTSHDSTDGFREFLAGLKDGGEVSYEGNWLPSDATHGDTSGILAAFEDDDVHNFQIVTPTDVGYTISFAAIPTDFSISFPLEEQGQLEGALKITGAVTVAETAT